MAEPIKSSGFTMRRETAEDQLLVEGYGGGGFKFKGCRFGGHVLVLDKGIYPVEANKMEAMTKDHLSELFSADPLPELVLIGTGEKMTLLPPGLRSALEQAHIGFDLMDTGAAARTYNVLSLEGRRVAALLIAVK